MFPGAHWGRRRNAYPMICASVNCRKGAAAIVFRKSGSVT